MFFYSDVFEVLIAVGTSLEVVCAVYSETEGQKEDLKGLSLVF